MRLDSELLSHRAVFEQARPLGLARGMTRTASERILPGAATRAGDEPDGTVSAEYALPPPPGRRLIAYFDGDVLDAEAQPLVGLAVSLP